MKVNLTYFKDTGKYYTECSYTTHCKHLFEIWQEVRNLRTNGELPGLCHGHSNFITLVDVPRHRNRHPHLII